MQIKRGKWMGEFIQGFHMVVNPRKVKWWMIRAWLRSIYETSFEGWLARHCRRRILCGRWLAKNLLWKVIGEWSFTKNLPEGSAEEGAERWRKIEGRYEVERASFGSAAQVSVFWRYLELRVSDWADSFWVGKLTSGATISMKKTSSDSACIKEEKDEKWRLRVWRRIICCFHWKVFICIYL